MDEQLNQNLSGTSPVIVKTKYAPNGQYFEPDNTITQCRFAGEERLIFTVNDENTGTTIGWPDWVLDFDVLDTGIPFTVDFNGKDINSWLGFSRYFRTVVSFVEPELDGDSVVEPGYWQVRLDVDQFASYLVAHFERTIVWWDAWHKELLERQGVFLDQNDFIFFAGFETYQAAVNPLGATYVAPDNFQCPITPGETYRFTKPLPTLTPKEFSDVTINSLPDGFGWPTHVPEYVLDLHGHPTSELTVYSGYLYPSGFSRADYLAPPYVDVRHVSI